MNTPPDKSADDPALQRIRTKLVRLMLASILITFVLVGLVLAAVIYKIMTPSEQAANMRETIEQYIDVGTDGQIVSSHLSGDVLALQIHYATKGDEFIFYDIRLQRIISRLRLGTDSASGTAGGGG